MTTPEILLTRIDNRLIHGQVATQWAKELQANTLIVANDEAAADTFRQELMNMAAPAGVKTRYVPVDEINTVLDEIGPDGKVFIIVADALDAKRLMDKSPAVKKINVGNMHMAEGTHQIATTVAVDDTDRDLFRQMKDAGAELFIQRVPGAAKENADALTK